MHHTTIPQVDEFRIKTEATELNSETQNDTNKYESVLPMQDDGELLRNCALNNFNSFDAHIRSLKSQDTSRLAAALLADVRAVEQRKYKCLFAQCDASYRSPAQFKRHVKSHGAKKLRQDVPRFKCNFCFELFDSKENLEMHEKTHNSEPTLKQHNVGTVISDSQKIKKSKNTILKSSGFKCDICNKIFRKKFLLTYHKARHSSERPFKCQLCNKAFKSNANLYSHGLIHSGDKRFKCDYCDYKAINNWTLEQHKVRRHTHCFDFACDKCGKCFVTSKDLREHMVTHGEKEVKCKICDAQFHFQSGLLSHLKTHDPNRIKSHLCDLCGKSFGGTSQLNVHKRTHLGTNKFKCETCGKEVTSQTSLRDHKRIHTGEKPYSCDVCGKCFSSRNVFRTHQQSHSGAKPHKCDECGKCYTQRSTLTIHLRSHTGVKPFACEICLKRFVTKTLLKTHEKKHND